MKPAYIGLFSAAFFLIVLIFTTPAAAYESQYGVVTIECYNAYPTPTCMEITRPETKKEAELRKLYTELYTALLKLRVELLKIQLQQLQGI